ncbi:MAG: uroporphyrinogen decarboxylase [candidate division Zixibacteria bacterium]|nr:uroporphyrinogen decarboxylase [candidate division Zixibacteria bacterium]
MNEHTIISAAIGQPHGHIPAWIMRQAGRYLPQYQDIKVDNTFAEICASPKLIADVTMQPVDILGVDAAIIFSDIIFPLKPMGLDISFSNKGPQISNPVRIPKDLGRISSCNPKKDLSIILEGINLVKARLEGNIPIIGFAGSPFTLACYVVEGRGSTKGYLIREFMYHYPEAAEKLLDMLAETVGNYLNAQIDAGAEMVQIFDSRGGILSLEDYERFSLPYIKKVCKICKSKKTPRIVFVNNSMPFLDMLSEIDCEVISVDWRTDIEMAFNKLTGKTIQGNLDPHLLLAPPDVLREHLIRLLDRVGHRDNYIFNLGHGIPPQTPVVNARLVIETVQNYKQV